jgi:hypothetical protein
LYRWEEVILAHDYPTRPASPAHWLMKLGVAAPKALDPWPRSFEKTAQSWNKDADWNATPRELEAWIMAWKAHPQGQKYLDQALACVAAVPYPDQFKQLMDGGANVNGGSKRTGPVLAKLLSSQNTALVVECLEQAQNSGIQINWPAVDDIYEQVRSVGALQAIEERGIRFPRPIQIHMAGTLVKDMPFNTELHSRLKALEWWLDDNRLGQDMPARAALIDRWLRTVRPGPEKEYQQSLCAMWQVLETPKLPDPPDDGSGDSWGHRWARSIFPADVAPSIVGKLLDHGGATHNVQGMTALDVLDENIQSHSWGSDAEALIVRDRLLARTSARELDTRVPGAAANKRASVRL